MANDLQVLVYPRGYIRLNVGCKQLDAHLENIVTSTPAKIMADKATVAIWEQQFYEPTSVMRSEYKLGILAHAARLYGHFGQWATLQAVAGTAVNGFAFDYLIDTLNFIRCGQRKMSRNTWFELIKEFPVPEQIDISTRLAKLRAVSDLPITTIDRDETKLEFISRWINQPDGLSDMIFSTNLFFGETKSPADIRQSR